MKCYFYVKLPNGGELRIPSTVNQISLQDQKFLELLPTSKEEGTSNLLAYLNSLHTGLTVNEINNIIRNTKDSEVITKLNELISKKVTNNSLQNAIWKNLNYDIAFDYKKINGTKYQKINFQELLNLASENKIDTYFNNLNITGVLNTTAPIDELNKLEDYLNSFSDTTIEAQTDNALFIILNNFYKGPLKHKKIFISGQFDQNQATVINNGTEDPTIVYDKNNYLSMFYGIFKHQGSLMSKENLSNVLLKYGITKEYTPEEFFIGKFIGENENLEFQNPILDSLSQNPNRDAIYADLVNIITGSKFLLNTQFDLLLKQIFNLGETNWVDKNKEASEEYGKISDDYLKSTLTQKGIKIQKYLEKKDDYYSPQETSKDFTDLESMVNFIKSNLSLGQDLILIPKKEDYTRYIVPVDVDIEDDRIKIRGFYNSEGKIKIATDRIYLGEIKFRKLAKGTKILNTTEANEINSNDSIVIKANKGEYVPKSLVLSSAVRGGRVQSETRKEKIKNGAKQTEVKTYWNTIKDVSPSKLLLNKVYTGEKQDVLLENPYVNLDRITTLITHKNAFEDEFTDQTWEEKVQTLKNYDAIELRRNPQVPIDSSDYILHIDEKGKRRYNKVLGISDDEKSIYILVKRNDKYYSEAISRDSVVNVYRKKPQVTREVFQEMSEFANRIAKDQSPAKFSYSSFDNFELSSEGDFVIIPKQTNEGVEYNQIYQILNKDKNLLAMINFDKKTLMPINEYLVDNDLSKRTNFITTRDISRSSAIENIEYNNLFLQTLYEGEDKTSMLCFIPSNLDFQTALLMPSGQLNIGTLVAEEIYNKNPKDYEGYTNVTEDLINAINFKRNINGTGLYVKTLERGYYQRFNKALYNSNFQEKTEQKRELLQPGAYIVLAKTVDGNMVSQNKLYQITSASADNITIEFNTFSHRGKILTVIKTIPKNSNDIMWIYAKKGNRKIGSKLEKLDLKIGENNNSPEDIIARNRIILSDLTKRFSTIFNIDVDHVYNTDLQSKQAWIESNEQGQRLVINTANLNSGKQNIIHEYLHLFFIALKYNDLSKNTYEEVLQNYKLLSNSKTEDLSELEEELINKLTNKINLGIENIIDYKSFSNAINSALIKLELEPITEDSNIFSILNTTMESRFPRLSHEIGNESLILFETNFREWMSEQIKNNNLEIQCQ